MIEGYRFRCYNRITRWFSFYVLNVNIPEAHPNLHCDLKAVASVTLIVLIHLAAQDVILFWLSPSSIVQTHYQVRHLRRPGVSVLRSVCE